MASGSPDADRWSRLLSQTLRAVRRRAGLRAADVAQRMGMPLRSYEHFEAGGRRVNLERIHEFAAATGADALAILASILMGSPAFAVRSSRNKMMLTLMLALQEFDGDAGDDMELLETGVCLAAFSEMFGQLAHEVRRRRQMADDVAQRSRASGLTSSPPHAEEGSEDD